MSQKFKVEILCGLPGAGKTTFAKQQLGHYAKSSFIGRERVIFEDSDKKVVVLDMDAYMMANQKTKPIPGLYLDFFNEITKVMKAKTGWRLIVDGLFLNHEDYIRVAKAFRDYHVVYHWWSPLREVCARNDKYRREKNSYDLIMNAEFNEPDPLALKLASASIGEIETIRHRPKPKSGYQLFCDRYNLGAEISSGTWSNGGTSYDCYGHSYDSGADSPLATFQEFDALIEAINEDIKFMQYKRLYNACVDTDTYNDAGYYGGSATSSKYICSTIKLYNALIENGLLPEEFI